MVRLLLVRHGETEWTLRGRYQGTTDTALTPHGYEQAAALALRLQAERIDAIYASPLQRAWDTARTIAEARGQTVHVEERLREIAFGAWEGLSPREIRQQDPATWDRWVADAFSFMPEGGEPLSSIAPRLHSLLSDLATHPDDANVLLVSHGGSLRVLICLALGLGAGCAWHLRMDNASLSELSLQGKRAILCLLNDRHHLNSGSQLFQ